MPTNQFKSANLKIDRASEHIGELDTLLGAERPFTYVLETNTKTGKRATYARRNEAVIDKVALISGDVVHNLHTALDHAYWEIVSPFTTKGGAQRSIQFPFTETAAKYEGAVKNRLAHKVSQAFFDAIMGLKAYGDTDGNDLLYLINKIDTPEKHRTLTPIGDFKSISSESIRQQVPDFPNGFREGSFGQNWRDVGWHSRNIDMKDLGKIVPPTTCVFEKVLDVPVDVVFALSSPQYTGSVIPTLNKLLRVVRETLTSMKAAT